LRAHLVVSRSGARGKELPKKRQVLTSGARPAFGLRPNFWRKMKQASPRSRYLQVFGALFVRALIVDGAKAAAHAQSCRQSAPNRGVGKAARPKGAAHLLVPKMASGFVFRLGAVKVADKAQAKITEQQSGLKESPAAGVGHCTKSRERGDQKWSGGPRAPR
jgi:hypothetical protein